MSITKEDKQRLIGEYRRDDADSGSPEVQVAVLSHRINALTEHLRTAKKDHAGRRGLRALVSKRRRHLSYLARTAPATYQELLQRLGLRK